MEAIISCYHNQPMARLWYHCNQGSVCALVQLI